MSTQDQSLYSRLTSNKKVLIGAAIAVALVVIIVLIMVFTPSGPKFVGCFTDKETRALPTHVQTRNNMSLAECRQAAEQAGSPYFGLQYGDPATGLGQCWIGNSATTLSQAQQYGAASNCKKMTNQDALNITADAHMGGDWSNAIYAI